MKNFLQKIFKGNEAKSTITSEQVKRSPTKIEQKNEPDLRTKIASLTEEGRFRTALDELFTLLEANPDDKTVSYLAATTVYLAQRPDHAYNAAEPLTEEYFNDTRLDPLFCQCDFCGDTWMPSPAMMMKAKHRSGRMFVFEALGAFCSNCKKTICRDCYVRKDATSVQCPECKTPLSGITEPNGRTPQQTRKRKEKLSLVMLFREGPVPPDREYVLKWLRKLSPEAFDDDLAIKAFPIYPWPQSKMEMQAQTLTICDSKNIYIPDTVDDFYLKDDDENHLYLVKFYEDKDQEVEINEQFMKNFKAHLLRLKQSAPFLNAFLDMYYGDTQITALASLATKEMSLTRTDGNEHGSSVLITPPYLWVLK